MKHTPSTRRAFTAARARLAPFAVAAVAPWSSHAQVVINEFDADTPGNDMAEFVELYDGGAGNTPLDGMVLVFFNGSTSATLRGSYEAFDLDGMQTDAGGYFLLANPGVGDVDARENASPATGLTFAPGGAGALENGEDAVALYAGLNADDFELSSSPHTVPGDIPLGAEVHLLDAVVYQTSDSRNGAPDPDSSYLAELGITGISLDENLMLTKDSASWARRPDGGTPLDQSLGWSLLDPPTPGTPNVPSFELDLSFSPTSVSESAGAGAVEVTLYRDGDAAAPLVVTFAGNDPTELEFPGSVTVPAGTNEFIFHVDVLDDGAADGTQTVTITASAPDFFPAAASIMVEDDGDAPTLVINEIYAEVEPGQDPNGDNAANFAGDEFVEVVNISGGSLDISGWVLTDLEGVRHIFPAGSILGSGCAAVVFGAGGFSEGVRADFGNALVQKASSGGLGLTDTGDTILIAQGGIERAGARFDDYDAELGDLTRKPELSGEFVNHVLADSGAPFSPGLRADNAAPFCTILERLSLAGAGTIAEDGGVGVTQYTISRTGPTDAPLTVRLASSDASEAQFQAATVEIPASIASVLVPVDAIDDAFVDGDQNLELVASAPGFVSAFFGIVVSDDGTDSNYILINELDIDTPGSDVAEFIELYDGGLGNTSLNGYAVVLYNGFNDQVYGVYDLDGKSTNAGGFFVIGSPGVPNVGLAELPGFAGFLQNGSPDADAVALYVGNESDFLVGGGAVGGPLDAVVYGGTGAQDDMLGLALGLGIARVGIDQPDETIARLPDGGSRLDLSGFGDGIPTPGESNQAVGGPAGYATWAAGFPGIQSPLSDDDCDGLINVVEYALGKHPLVPDRDGVPGGGIVGGQLRLSISKGSEASADAALSYAVEASTDLAGWSGDDTTVLISNASTLSVAYTGAATRAYLRLRVELNSR